jgi:hypothetical protein
MRKSLNSQNSLLLGKLYWLTGNVVISEVDALLFVVLSKAKKSVLWAIGTIECIMLLASFHTI